MLVNSIHFTFDSKDANIVEDLLRELRDAEQPNAFALWEVYQDKEALDAHLESDHFQRLYVGTVKPLVQRRDMERVVLI